MLPLPAQLITNARSFDKRGAVRRLLSLEVQASARTDAISALIRNLSEQGLLIETVADLAVGETIQVDLPEAGACEARVIRREGSSFGCEFLIPVPRAAVSAALLLAPIEFIPAPALPRLTGLSVFGEEWPESEIEPKPYPPEINAVLMASLVLALMMVTLFIYALLNFPFAT